MIKNEKQYRITKAAAVNFERALSVFSDDPAAHPSVHQRLVKAEKDGLKSQLQTLRREMREYEALRSGRVKTLKCGQLAELPALLIRSRIVRGWTQKKLGEVSGLVEEQIQNYEASDYESASLTRIVEMATVLGIDFTGTARLREFAPERKRCIAA